MDFSICKNTTIQSLNFNAPFDVVDPLLVTEYLKNDFGITDTALKWLQSY